MSKNIDKTDLIHIFILQIKQNGCYGNTPRPLGRTLMPGKTI